SLNMKTCRDEGMFRELEFLVELSSDARIGISYCHFKYTDITWCQKLKNSRLEVEETGQELEQLVSSEREKLALGEPGGCLREDSSIMAKFNPPSEFKFDRPADWPEWKQRFSRYRLATKLNKDNGEIQVSSLIYSMGSEAEKIFSSFSFDSEEEGKDFDKVLKKFDEYFIPRRNVIHERACFYQRSQQPGETAEQYIRALYELAEYCEFGDKRDEHIRDRLVVGILDKGLSRKFQLKADLTLAEVIEQARQAEEIIKQVNLQSNPPETQYANVNALRHRVSPQSDGRGRGEQRVQRQSGSVHQGRYKAESCGRCGKAKHSEMRRCPALMSKCKKCHKQGHWERVCHSKQVSEVTQEVKQSYFLGEIGRKTCSKEDWTVNLEVSNVPITFKIDTGADATVINLNTCKMMKPKIKLSPPDTSFVSPGGHLSCVGLFWATTKYKEKQYSFKVYVMRGRVSCLLGLPEAVNMGLVKRVDEVGGVFKSGGLLNTEPVEIVLQDDAKPYSVHTARRIPLPLVPLVKKELHRMESEGIIEKVTKPTEWCAAMVPVLKPNKKEVRCCADLRKLNRAVKREKYVLPTVDEILPRLGGSTVFTTLDAASGFYQIPLHENSKTLTTFITPFGRYAFRRLPFGITSAPEIFQRKMVETLAGLEGVELFMDDILVHGATEEIHDQRLDKTLKVIEASGLKLNEHKCKFRQTQVRFLGHVIDKAGSRPDPDKVAGIENFPQPNNITELKRFLGMVNYLAKYVPELSTIAEPLYALLKGKMEWAWEPAQQTAFQNLKTLLATAPVLTYYDAGRPTAVSADASSYGLGAVLLQQHGDQWKPVAYASRRLSDTETRYAQIEKECLASVWACERFDKYLFGLASFRLITDHKPLVPLINSKDLDNVPIRCQRLLMRLMRFSGLAEYAPGKTLAVADALSRGPEQCYGDRDLQDDVAAHIDNVISQAPATPQRIRDIKQSTVSDPQLQAVRSFIRSGWPEYLDSVPESARDFYQVRGELSEVDGLVLRGSRIVIPEGMRKVILERIHDGHQGLNKCRERALQSVWWPKMGQDIVTRVQQCSFCTENRNTQRKEPLISTELPSRPWQRVAVDLCEFKKQNYLVVSDYFSRFLEVLHLPTTTSSQVVSRLKATFARYGIPEVLVSDNGPQLASAEMSEFSKSYDFTHVTSSPHFPQSNGHAERAVQIAKHVLRQDDPLLALMAYRATPNSSTGVSPAELLMGRKIRTTLPVLQDNLKPSWPNLDKVKQADKSAKQRQAYYYNRRNGVQELPPLRLGDSVLTKLDGQKQWTTPAVVHSTSSTPRSYIVETSKGECYRRNRRHLLAVPDRHMSDNKGSDVATPTVDEDIEVTNGTIPVLEYRAKTLSGTGCSGAVWKNMVSKHLISSFHCGGMKWNVSDVHRGPGVRVARELVLRVQVSEQYTISPALTVLYDQSSPTSAQDIVSNVPKKTSQDIVQLLNSSFITETC
ncbi:hypothetical protein NFI96_001996, partial [Prochilodus magdalenae]